MYSLCHQCIQSPVAKLHLDFVRYSWYHDRSYRSTTEIDPSFHNFYYQPKHHTPHTNRMKFGRALRVAMLRRMNRAANRIQGVWRRCKVSVRVYLLLLLLYVGCWVVVCLFLLLASECVCAKRYEHMFFGYVEEVVPYLRGSIYALLRNLLRPFF